MTSSKALDTTVSREDIKAALKDMCGKAQKAQNSSTTTLNEYATEYQGWKDRATRVSRIMALTKSKEAREDLKILATQAIDYRKHYESLYSSQNEYHRKISDKKQTLDEAWNRFETMERRLSLKQEIARIAGKGGLEASTSMPGIDFDEINRIIHTATALIELREDKGISA